MDAKDPHILAAMDGKEVSEQNSQVIATTNSKEPTAFFFVIFGFVYEAIATASADASSESRSGVISALTALKSQVRPNILVRRSWNRRFLKNLSVFVIGWV